MTTLLHCHWWNFWSSNTDVKIILWMKSIENINIKYKSKPNLQLAFSGISSFSDWLLICWIWSVWTHYFYTKLIVYILIFVYIWHSFISISRDRNIRDDFHGSRSRAKVISFQPIPPFHFSFTVPLNIEKWLYLAHCLTDKGCKGTIVNQALSCLHGVWLEIGLSLYLAV